MAIRTSVNERFLLKKKKRKKKLKKKKGKRTPIYI